MGGAVKYQPGGSVTVDKTAPTNDKTIYAIWKNNLPFDGITTMQEMNSSICSAATPGQAAILEDTRDGKKYYVTRTADDNCWMTQNLAYGTVSDTSIGTPCKLSGTGDGATCIDGTSWTNSNSDKYFAIGSHIDGNHSSRGNYYNWPAATQDGSGDGVQGVCPPNWQLPTSLNTDKTRKSFGGLTTAYSIDNNEAGSTKLRGEPLYFQYGGYISSGKVNDADSHGLYWSSTPRTSNTDFAYTLDFTSSRVSPSSNFTPNSRYNGFSVRCVAK